MSLDIDWEKLVSDDHFNQHIKELLNDLLSSVTLPSFIDDLKVTSFSLGQRSPEIVIRHIGDPLEDFYKNQQSSDSERDGSPHDRQLFSESEGFSDSDSEGDNRTNSVDFRHRESALKHEPDSLQLQKSHDQIKNFYSYTVNHLGLGPQERETPTKFFKPDAYRLQLNLGLKPGEENKSDGDIQFLCDVNYEGDALIEVCVNLLVNYPSKNFISLPIKLRITELEIHVLAVIAYLQNSVFVSILCDLEDPRSDYFTSTNSSNRAPEVSSGSSDCGGNFIEYAPSSSKERIEVIRGFKIDTEIGQVENNVLRNVGKVEKFVIEEVKKIIRSEICWPGWLCFEIDEDLS